MTRFAGLTDPWPEISLCSGFLGWEKRLHSDYGRSIRQPTWGWAHRDPWMFITLDWEQASPGIPVVLSHWQCLAVCQSTRHSLPVPRNLYLPFQLASFRVLSCFKGKPKMLFNRGGESFWQCEVISSCHLFLTNLCALPFPIQYPPALGWDSGSGYLAALGGFGKLDPGHGYKETWLNFGSHSLHRTEIPRAGGRQKGQSLVKCEWIQDSDLGCICMYLKPPRQVP